MSMSCIDPAGRRKGNKGVGEINEDINEMPVPDGVGVTIGASLHPPVVLIAALHVMADQETRPLWCTGRDALKGHAALVEGEVERVQVAEILQLVESFQRVRFRHSSLQPLLHVSRIHFHRCILHSKLPNIYEARGQPPCDVPGPTKVAKDSRWHY
ncbi:hypothetical protein L7F22_067460 [Adiantum nelumboides]|nr:hypothetical protein [Adiantum nelumboides]